MSRNYKIATEFSVVDRATAQLNKMSSAGGLVGSAWSKGISQAQARLDRFGASVKAAGKMAVGLGVGAVGAGLVVATKQYADFDQAVRAAGAAYGPAFSQAADFEDKIKGMGKAVRDVAAATEFDATQAATAMQTLALAGVKSEQAVALLPGVADLATAAMTSMDDAVALAVGSLNTMGMMSDKPKVLSANMQRLSDVMAHTANSAYMSLQDVSAAISQGGSFFRTTNNDLNILSGSLTALAANSIRGAEAGTAVRNIMTNLSAPTSKAAQALANMNVKTTDAAGNLLPLPKIIGQMNKAMAGMGDAEKNANLYEIFGKQNIAAVTALLNTGQTALEDYAAAAANSAGTVTANAEAMRGSLVNKFKVLQSALTELGFKFVDAFAAKGGGAIEAITKAVSEFDPTPLVNALVGVVDVIASVAKVAWKLRGVILVAAGAFALWRTVTTLAAIALGVKNGVTILATGFQIAYGIVIKKSAAATAAYTFATNKAKIASVLFSGVLKVATAAQWLFNAAMSANPIGLIVAGVVLLIGLIVVLTGKWQKVTAAVDGFFERIRNMKGIGGAILKGLVAPLEFVWNSIRGIFDTINAFKVGGFIAGIKMLGLSILQMIAAPLQAILESLSWIPGLGWLHDKINGWFDKTRAGILAGSAAGDAGTLPSSEEDSGDIAMTPPTMTAATANSYSREESVTTNRVEIGLDEGLSVKSGAMAAPAFTLRTGRKAG